MGEYHRLNTIVFILYKCLEKYHLLNAIFSILSTLLPVNTVHGPSYIPAPPYLLYPPYPPWPPPPKFISTLPPSPIIRVPEPELVSRFGGTIAATKIVSIGFAPLDDCFNNSLTPYDTCLLILKFIYTLNKYLQLNFW